MYVSEDKATPCSRCHRHPVQPPLIFDHELYEEAVAEEEGLGGVFPENHSSDVCHTEGEARIAVPRRVIPLCPRPLRFRIF